MDYDEEFMNVWSKDLAPSYSTVNPKTAREYKGPTRKKRDFNKYITVRFEYVGFHAYKNAPEKVAFLRNNHRHKFHAECVIEVFHNDRELEFILVLEDISSEILPFMLGGELGSCEMQAEFIANGILELYGEHRYVKVSIDEDGENGGSVEWVPEEG